MEILGRIDFTCQITRKNDFGMVRADIVIKSGREPRLGAVGTDSSYSKLKSHFVVKHKWILQAEIECFALSRENGCKTEGFFGDPYLEVIDHI